MGLIIIVSGNAKLSELDALAAQHPEAEIICEDAARSNGILDRGLNPIEENFVFTELPRYEEPIVLPKHSNPLTWLNHKKRTRKGGKK